MFSILLDSIEVIMEKSLMSSNDFAKTTDLVKVRFAPSPTGYLHIGGARTALFNWFFARQKEGEFILRIEDTDKQRSTQGAIDEILKSLAWLGLDWDKGPFFQSERTDLYKEAVQNLLDRDLAYRAKESIGGGKAILFRMPEETIEIRDLVYGKLVFDTSLLEDQVLLRSDGSPTYNLACVVDDINMGITHLLRGDDHISNTPKQVALYRALGCKPPVFAHLPMILGDDEKPLSKRHGAVAVSQYKEEGFLPEALTNYLALLGWSPGGDKELMSVDELVRYFSIKRINKKGAVFSEDKLLWMNGQKIRQLQPEVYCNIAVYFLQKAGIVVDSADQNIQQLLRMHQPRTKLFSELSEQTEYFFREFLAYEEAAAEKYLLQQNSERILVGLLKRWTDIEEFLAEYLETELRCYAESLSMKAGHVIHPLRVALTGKSASPGIFEVAQVLGRERVLDRIQKALDWIKMQEQQ
ncbi:MAG: glutamate--tRNA ligase [Candidatus Theseobacter exili]|nr:glutamate--tRNA ligase [Candidatus Theseobacter exili]